MNPPCRSSSPGRWALVQKLGPALEPLTRGLAMVADPRSGYTEAVSDIFTNVPLVAPEISTNQLPWFRQPHD